MFPLLRCIASAILLASIACLDAATTDSFPLKFTALFGSEAQINGMAVDIDGNIVVAGTAIGALPVTAGAFQTNYQPATCPQAAACPVAFAAKLSHDGASLLYLTYLGSSYSTASAVAVDSRGNAWVAGSISSADLPVTQGAVQKQLKGRTNGFLLELNSTGSRLLFATYLGGSSPSGDMATSLALDSNGNVYVAGSAASLDFPVTAGAFQTANATSPPGGGSPFAAKFDASGALLYSTFFHGDNPSTTYVSSIAADSVGNLYLTGLHAGKLLPTTPGALQTSAGTTNAAFVSKLDPSGSKLVYSTYLSANYPTTGNALGVDAQGNAYVAGSIRLGTDSTPAAPSTFPTTAGAFQSKAPDFEGPTFFGMGFVAKLNSSGSALGYSTLLYTSDDFEPYQLAVDRSGAVLVTGGTYSFDFPTTPGALHQCSVRTTFGYTSVAAKLAPDGSSLLYSTYLGADSPKAVAIDSSGEVYFAGDTLALATVVPGSFGWTGTGGGYVMGLNPVPLPAGSVSCVANAASRTATAVAAGEIVDVFGNGIGPAKEVSATPSGGRFDTSLSGVRVLVNGVAAPLLFAGPNQIRAVIPFEGASSGGTATIQILNGVATIQPTTVPVAAIAPALFSVDGSAAGQLLMINEDGKLNSKSNPARLGSLVSVYATGLNNTQPALATGSIATGAAPLAVQAQLQIGSAAFGQCQILYAGAAPGLVAGVTQINLRLPTSTSPGGATVYLSGPGGATSQSNLYFFVR